MKDLKDGGSRTVYSTGAMKESTGIGKGRYDLIPPAALKRLAVHYERGAAKYNDRNWEKGIPFSRLIDSLIRHASQWLAGDRDEDHMAAVAWNAFALMHHETAVADCRLPIDLADLPTIQKISSQSGLGVVKGAPQIQTDRPVPDNVFWDSSETSISPSATFTRPPK